MTKASRVKLPKEPTRKQRSRTEREALQRRNLLIGMGVVLAVTVGLLLAGVLDARVLQPRQPVAKVGTVGITTEDYQKRVRYQHLNIINSLNQLQQQRAQFENDPNLSFYTDQIDQQMTELQSELTNPPLLGKQVLDAMIDEEIIRQEAARRAISLPPEEVTTFIEQDFFGYYRVPPTPAPTSTPLPTPSVPVTITPEPTQTPLPSPTPISQADYDSAYRNYTTLLSQQAGMTENDFRRLVENELLRRKLQEVFTAEVPADVDQLKLRYVQLESEAASRVAQGLLSGGADFNRYYAQVDSGEIVSATAGETGWMLVSDMSQQFEQQVVDQLLSLPISGTTGVVTTTFGGSYAFQVAGHELRPLSDSQKQTQGEQTFDDWLSLQRVAPDMVDYLNDRYIDVTPAYTTQS